MFELTTGAEVLGLCQSATLHNDTPLWVNTIEMSAGSAWHHSNWFFVPESMYAGADGTWDCNSRNFDQVQAAARKYIAADKSVIVVVGDASKVAKALEKFGAVTVMKVEP